MSDKKYKILLTHSNLLHNDPKQKRKMKPYPPLATIRAAALLRSHGFKLCLVDTTFDKDLKRFHDILSDFNPDILIVFEDYFNFIIKMCLGHIRNVTKAMCRKAQDAGIISIVANPDTTDNPRLYLENGADYVVFGEPDTTVLELCQVLSVCKDPIRSNVRGIAGILPDSGMIATGARNVLCDENSFPRPAWDKIDIEPYRQAWLSNHGYFSLNTLASKGCPYSCTWCAKPIWGNSYIQKSESLVVNELEWLIKQFKPDHFWFVDDLFGYNEKWLKTFSAAVKDSGIKFSYTIQTRADIISPEVLSYLRQSGCKEVWMGAESGSQRVLNAMKKGISVDRIKSAVAGLKSAGIRAGLFLQFGYLGETMDDILATVDLIRETSPDDIGISVTYPLPGTELYRIVRNELKNKTQWNHSDDLSMLFNGSYTTEFYRKLHQVLHAELDFIHLHHNNTKVTKWKADKMARKLSEDWETLINMEKTHHSAIQP